MSKLFQIPSYSDSRGDLYVIEKLFDFEIKRIYFIKNVDNSIRGKHRHKITKQALIAVSGKCDILIQSNECDPILTIELCSPNLVLFLEPDDFHWMRNFSEDCILLVLASEDFDPDDYIYTPYTPLNYNN